jgi:hypothetical protein
MPKEPPRILAVNPGSRYIGIAVFRGSELLDWGVKVVGGRTPSGKLGCVRAILRDCIERYDPDVLSIKRLHRSRSSPRLRDLTRKIIVLSRRRGIEVHLFSIRDLEGAHCAETTKNKRKLAEAVVSMYPALTHALQHEKANKNPYHIRMFEAVALGIVHSQQSENH